MRLTPQNWRVRILHVFTLVFAGLVLSAPSAQADHHLIKIREVFPGSTAAGSTAEFVELQMFAPGQNHFPVGTFVRYFSASGADNGGVGFSQTFPNGDNQRSVLIATTAAESHFGITADASYTPFVEQLTPDGGAVCFESPTFGPIDCVSWGGFGGSLPSLAGTPAAAIADGSSLTRSTALGCPTLLEASDDTDNSAADLAVSVPSPRNNTTTPTEAACLPDTQGPVQTLTAKKKQDVDKAFVNERLDEAGTVTLKGRVTIPAASRAARFRTVWLATRAVKAKKASKSLVADKKTKIKIKFTQRSKEKIRDAIEASGPRRITVTATAKDAAGNSSTKKVKFKLTD